MNENRDDIDTAQIVTVAFGGAFFIAAFILFVQAWFFSVQYEDDASKQTKPLARVRYEQEQEAKLQDTIATAKNAVVTQLHQ